jgi:hypothetical protein
MPYGYVMLLLQPNVAKNSKHQTASDSSSVSPILPNALYRNRPLPIMFSLIFYL